MPNAVGHQLLHVEDTSQRLIQSIIMNENAYYAFIICGHKLGVSVLNIIVN
jgi:hypothetical protein